MHVKTTFLPSPLIQLLMSPLMLLSQSLQVLCAHSMYCTYNLIPWLAAVNQISKENGILGAGQPASSYLPRALLDFDALIVLIDCLQQENKKLTSTSGWHWHYHS